MPDVGDNLQTFAAAAGTAPSPDISSPADVQEYYLRNGIAPGVRLDPGQARNPATTDPARALDWLGRHWYNWRTSLPSPSPQEAAMGFTPMGMVGTLEREAGAASKAALEGGEHLLPIRNAEPVLPRTEVAPAAAPELLPTEVPEVQRPATWTPPPGPEGALTPAPIRSPVRPNAAGRAAIANAGTGRSGLTTLGLRSMPSDDALAMVRNGAHLQRDSSGQYIGAPRGIDSPRRLQRMRAQFDDLVSAGVGGEDWYDKVRTFISTVAGGDPVKERLLAEEIALTSPQATPETNLQFTLQAHNAFELGQPAPVVRTGAQARNYNESRFTNSPMSLGNKTRPFANKMDPTQPADWRSVNDIWHARAFGYTNKGGKLFSRALSQSEHDFLTAETQLAADRANALKLGGRNDWSAPTVQAAPWVAGKAADILRKSNGKLTPEQAFAAAAKTYPDYQAKHTVAVTHEAIPGAGTGHLPGLLEAEPAAREAYAAAPASTWATAPGGRDVLYDAAGLWTRPTVEGAGAFTPPGGATEFNPMQVARPMVPFERSMGPTALDSRALSAIEATRGYLDAQLGSAWQKARPVGGTIKVGSSDTVTLPFHRAMTSEEMQALHGALAPHGLTPIDTGEGILVRDFSGADRNGNQIRAIVNHVGNATPEGAGAPVRAKTYGDYIDYSGAYAEPHGTGAATRILQKYWEHPEMRTLFQKIDADPRLRAAAAARLERDAALGEHYGGVSEPVQNARRIFKEGGLTGIFDALKRGEILPAAAAGLLGFGLEQAYAPGPPS